MKFVYLRCSGCGAEVRWPALDTPTDSMTVLCFECSKGVLDRKQKRIVPPVVKVPESK